MNYNSFKIHSEANTVASNMLNSHNRFIQNIGVEIVKADIWKLLDIKNKIDTHWPDLWDSYWIKESASN